MSNKQAGNATNARPFAALGDRLQEERVRLGLSQARFANAVEIGHSTLVGYEAGARCAGADVLARMDNLGADILYIVTGRRTPEGLALEPEAAAVLRRWTALGDKNRLLVAMLLDALGNPPPFGSHDRAMHGLSGGAGDSPRPVFPKIS